MAAVSFSFAALLTVRACWSLVNVALPELYWFLLSMGGAGDAVEPVPTLLIRWSEVESIGICLVTLTAHAMIRPGTAGMLLVLSASLGLRCVYFSVVVGSQLLFAIDLVSGAITFAAYWKTRLVPEPERQLPIRTWTELVILYCLIFLRFALIAWNTSLRHDFGMVSERQLHLFIVWQFNLWCAACLAAYHLGLYEQCFILAAINGLICFMNVGTYDRPFSQFDMPLVNFATNAFTGVISIVVVLHDLWMIWQN